MPVAVYRKDYNELKQAYLEVKGFLESEVGDKVSSLRTQIGNDLGFDGDDSWELLEKFINKYNLETAGFDFSQHFLFEGEISNSETAFLQIVSFPIIVLCWLTKLLSSGRLDLTKGYKFPDIYRDTLDMSFGDLLTWYLTGKYSLRKDVRFQL